MIEVNKGEVRERHLPAAWGLARGQIVAARKAHLIPKVDWRYERDVIIHPKRVGPNRSARFFSK